jgi:sugar phosphate isomerase/epimerase
MRHSVCVYTENIDEIFSRTNSSTELELQSFGLQGVKSIEAWNYKADFYADYVKKNPGRTYHLHGPFLDLTYYTYDHLIEEVVHKRINDTCNICDKVKPDHLVMHLNCPGYFCEEAHAQQWVQAATEFWKPYLDRLAVAGTQIVFENVMEPDPVSSIAFLNALKDYYVGFCLDVGHAFTFTNHAPALWVREMGNLITHFHIHDNAGDDDSHMAPGRGSIDFDELYTMITHHCPESVLSMEVDTGSDEILSALQFSQKLSADKKP